TATVADNDYVPTSGTLTFAAGETSKTITVFVNGDNIVEGDETFSLILSNAVGANIGNGTATGTIVNDDHAPVANDDDAAGTANNPIVVPVLANDTDADGDPLTVTAVGPAQHGSVTVNADNTVTYMPNTDFAGVDSFQYTISDGGNPATATVFITVNPQ